MGRTGKARAQGRTRGALAGGSLAAQLAALESASFETLRERFPEMWAAVGPELAAAIEARRAEGAADFLRRARARAAPFRQRLAKSGGNPAVVDGVLPELARCRLVELGVRGIVEGAVAELGAQSGRKPGFGTREVATSLRFGLWSGRLVQSLFFDRGLTRKPVSPLKHRLLWPLVTQKEILMPLVEPKGIYCFYGRPLITALARLAAGRRALEIAAGDGTLSRFLRAAGAAVRATDDFSWRHAIQFPDSVERLDAAAALERYAPEVVFCSWPPPGNRFERVVFATPSVKTYVVLTTGHRFAAGHWAAYEDETAFQRRTEQDLSRWLYPREVDPVILRFDRRQPA